MLSMVVYAAYIPYGSNYKVPYVASSSSRYDTTHHNISWNIEEANKEFELLVLARTSTETARFTVYQWTNFNNVIATEGTLTGSTVASTRPAFVSEIDDYFVTVDYVSFNSSVPLVSGRLWLAEK